MPAADTPTDTLLTGVDVEAAAWYADPTERYEQRWWDRRGWTDHVRNGDATSRDLAGSDWF